MGRSRDIADMLSKTELANTNNERLIIEDTVGVDSAYVSSNALQALSFFNTLDSLPVTGLTAGQQAYVDSNNRLYISDGSGWYNKAFITLTPTITLDPSGTIVLSNDGVTTSTVTIVAVDSDTPGSGLTYSVDSDGNGIGKYVISQDSSVFTIRPLSEDSGATAGTFTLTFSTTDGDNIATDSSEFSLTFAAVIDSSAETVLLMKAAGNSATNAAITYQNSSDVSTGFTEAGDPQATTFNPYRSGGYSYYGDGSGDYLNIDLGASGGPDGDCTFEFWAYYTNGSTNSGFFHLSSTSGGFNSSNVAYGIGKNNGTFRFYKGSSGAIICTTAHASYDNTWVHLALVRSSGTLTLYINGVADATTGSNSSDNSNQRYLAIGGYYSTSFLTPGYIRDFRYVKGTAVYTSNFIPPTEPLTAISGTQFLMGGLPYFADQSTNGHTVTINGDTKTVPFGPYDYEVWSLTDHGNSVHFDGTGDYITPNAITAPGTGAVTYEAWVRQENGGSSNHTIFDASTNGFGGGNGITVQISSNACQIITSDGITTAAGTQFQDEVWHHVAVVRNASNSIKYYVDGVAIFTGISYSGNTTSTSCRIGATNAATPGNLFQGYIANARVTNAEVYTSNFTPPTAPLIGISNTQLVMYNGQDTNVYDAAAANGLTLIGNTQSSTTQRKFTTSSAVYFDGTGDAIDVPETGFPAIGTADFTIETWVRASSLASNIAIFDGRPSGTSSGNYITLQWHASTYGVGFYSGGWRIQSPTDTLTVNTWHHIALSRSGSSTKLFVDGTQVGSTYSDSTSYLYGRNYIGGLYNNTNTWWNGYMQDFRVSIGHARYTANFTPPTAEFEL